MYGCTMREAPAKRQLTNPKILFNVSVLQQLKMKKADFDLN